MYLAFINLVLGVFNLLPGFPLDGGRVLRSFVWARTRNLLKATEFASFGGRIMGAILAIVGFLEFLFAGSAFGGLWLVVIGWFLYTQAGASYQVAAVTDVLSRIKVESLIRRDFHVVAPHQHVDTFVSEFVLGHHDRCYPVMSGEGLLGLI